LNKKCNSTIIAEFVSFILFKISHTVIKHTHINKYCNYNIIYL